MTSIRPAQLIALVALACVCCVKSNPKYCDENSPCKTGLCNLMHACVLTDGSLDAADADGGAIDGAGDAADGGTGDADGGAGDARTDVAPPCTATSCSGALPICDLGSGACRACANDADCRARADATPFCASGACVACVANTGCSTAPTKPICDSTNVCRACANGNECMVRSADTPACASSGTCVACVTSADCLLKTKPVCNTATNSCRACQADSECPTDPGVCMAHTDGHCAAPGETIYVQNNPSSCDDTLPASDPTAGTSNKPLCSMQPVAMLLAATRDLVLVRGVVQGGSWTFTGQGAPETSIVGRQNAAIGSITSPAFSMQGGSVYVRGVAFSPSAAIGISAKGGALALDTVTVDSCRGGGILLDGASFDIRNTTVTNNGPGQQGAIAWGGILVNALPATGSTQLSLTTIVNNKAPGLTCAGAIQGPGVFATGNSTLDISTTCKITACAPLGGGCGAP